MVNYPSHLPSTDLLASKEAGNERDKPIEKDGYDATLRFFVTLQVQTCSRRGDLVNNPFPADMNPDVFAEHTSLGIMLRPEEDPVSGNTALVQSKRGCQFACLFYINQFLADLQRLRSLRAGLVNHIRQTIVQCNIDLELGTKLLFFHLLRDAPTRDMNRLWWVVQGVRVARRLSSSTSALLHKVLLQQVQSRSAAQASQQLCDLETLWLSVQLDCG